MPIRSSRRNGIRARRSRRTSGGRSPTRRMASRNRTRGDRRHAHRAVFRQGPDGTDQRQGHERPARHRARQGADPGRRRDLHSRKRRPPSRSPAIPDNPGPTYANLATKAVSLLAASTSKTGSPVAATVVRDGRCDHAGRHRHPADDDQRLRRHDQAQRAAGVRGLPDQGGPANDRLRHLRAIPGDRQGGRGAEAGDDPGLRAARADLHGEQPRRLPGGDGQHRPALLPVALPERRAGRPRLLACLLARRDFIDWCCRFEGDPDGAPGREHGWLRPSRSPMSSRR